MPHWIGPLPTRWSFNRFRCLVCGLLWLEIAEKDGPLDGACPRC